MKSVAADVALFPTRDNHKHAFKVSFLLFIFVSVSLSLCLSFFLLFRFSPCPSLSRQPQARFQGPISQYLFVSLFLFLSLCLSISFLFSDFLPGSLSLLSDTYT